MGNHHLRFGGTISWEKVSEDCLRVKLSDKYKTPVTILLGKKTLRQMWEVLEPPETGEDRIKRAFGK